jgi:hypothetical protein
VIDRAAGLKCRVIHANCSRVTDPALAETIFPVAELDSMLPPRDTVLIACALAIVAVSRIYSKTQAEGAAEKAAGKVQNAVGGAKDAVREAAKK